MFERLHRIHDHLLKRASEPPAPGSRDVFIADRPCGVALPAICGALQNAGLARIVEGGPNPGSRAGSLHIGSGLAPGPQLNALLDRIARHLHDASLLRTWRGELLDVWDAGEQYVGVIERGAVRALGLLTHAVHLHAFTPDGRLWMAQRALTKATDPGLWDTLVGGLVAAGEPLDEALTRECGEEAGLDAPDIRQRTPLRAALRLRRRLPEGYQLEDLLVSTCVLADGVTPANRDGEVMTIAAMHAEEVLGKIEAGEVSLEAALIILETMRRAFS